MKIILILTAWRPQPKILLEDQQKDSSSLSDQMFILLNRLGTSRVTQTVKCLLTIQGPRFDPTPVLLPGKSHGWRSLVGYSPWGRKESDMTEQPHFHFHALEKEMATHSSILAWRIPGTGKPGGLLSMGSHTVGQD